MYYCTGLVRAAGVWGSQVLWTSRTWKWEDGQLHASAAFTPRRHPLLFISVSDRFDHRAVEWPGGLSERTFSFTPLFSLPVLSDIPPHNINVSVASTIRYTPTLLLFLQPVIRYTPTILLFLKPVLSDIPSQCFSSLKLCRQIHPQNIAVSGACAVIYISKIYLFLKNVLSDMPSQDTEVVHAVIFWSGMSNSFEQLTIDLQAAYLYVCLAFVYKEINFLYVRIISDNWISLTYREAPCVDLESGLIIRHTGANWS